MNTISTNRHPHSVLFATPVKPPIYPAENKWSTIKTILALNQYNIPYSFIESANDSFLDKVRNRLLTYFVEDELAYENLFYIDADIGWPPEKIVEFLQRPEPVLGAVAQVQSDDGKVRYPIRVAQNPDGSCIQRDGLLLVDDLMGFAFVRIKRWVIDKLCEHFTDTFFDSTDEPLREYRWIFDRGPEKPGGMYITEDCFFIRRCKELGIDCWVDPNVTLSHRGSYSWTGQLADILRSEPTIVNH